MDSKEFSEMLMVESRMLGQCYIEKKLLLTYIHKRGEILRNLATKVMKGLCCESCAVRLLKEDVHYFVANGV